MQKYFGDLTIFMVQDLTAERQIKKISKQENNDIMFMANVAHDLRSPLNCLRGYNEII
jgi:signal transduction histidine kinase